MRVWRICRRRFADLSGEGARLHGGRWNSPGRAVVYAAEDAALAALEIRVHLDLDWDLLPDDYVLMAIELPARKAQEAVAPPGEARREGDAWLASGASALLKVPSAIIPESFNVLLNPAHRDFASAAIASLRDFAFDKRLWRPR